MPASRDIRPAKPAFSKNISGVKPSAIREIFKHTANPKVVPFALGDPDIRAFPSEAIGELSGILLREEPVNCLQYAVTEGFAPLREAISHSLDSAGAFAEAADGVIVTSGAQQAIDAVSKILINPGDTVITDAASFVGSLNTFRTYGAVLKGVAYDKDGIIPEALEEILRSSESPAAFVYLIPNFQNPTGITVPAERREDILNLIYKYGTFLLEDDPYGEIYFGNPPPKSFKALELSSEFSEQRVIYAGSFSKTVSPGLRVGFMAAGSSLTSKATVALQASTVHANIWAQKIVYGLISGKTGFDYAQHLIKLRGIYKKKCDLMADTLRQGLPEGVSVTKPGGGFFLWLTLGKGKDIPAFTQRLLERKVAVVPGNAFYPDGTKPADSVRLCFSAPSEEQIERGCRIAAETVCEFL